jgi:hypothetical protein
MKKLLIFTLAVIITAGMAGLALAGNGAGITGSPHDLRATIVELQNTGYGKSEICRICHSPHDHGYTQQYYQYGLLWNHEVSNATYTMYDSNWGFDIDGNVEAQPVGVSKLCLACHDGTVAIDTFDKYAGGAKNITDYPGVASATSRKVPGFTDPLDPTKLDLTGTHPISIEYYPYDGTAGDPWLKPVTAPMGGSGTIADVLDYSTGSTKGLVQCSSCHDVHDAPVESVANTPLLRVDLEGSAICLACHIK